MLIKLSQILCDFSVSLFVPGKLDAMVLVDHKLPESSLN